MAKNKTTFTDQKVSDFIDQLLTEEQKSDSLELIQIMEKQAVLKQECGVLVSLGLANMLINTQADTKETLP